VWILYLLECKRGTATVFYSGITTDMARRFKQHQTGTGARFTRANPPLRVLASRGYPNRSEASRAEAALKKLPSADKLAFFDGATFA
jgi:putative endonuclease